MRGAPADAHETGRPPDIRAAERSIIHIKEAFVTMKVQPFTLLLGRVALGVVFAAHGWQKFSGTGLDDVEAAFERMHHGDVLRSVVIL